MYHTSSLHTQDSGFVLEADGVLIDVTSYVLSQFQAHPDFWETDYDSGFEYRLPKSLRGVEADLSEASDQLQQGGEVLQMFTQKLVELTKSADVFGDWFDRYIPLISIRGDFSDDFLVMTYALGFESMGTIRGVTLLRYPDGSEVVLQDNEVNRVMDAMGI